MRRLDDRNGRWHSRVIRQISLNKVWVQGRGATERREMTLTTESGLHGQYVPIPVEKVRRQVAEYEASGGVKGETLEGRPVVILTSPTRRLRFARSPSRSDRLMVRNGE